MNDDIIAKIELIQETCDTSELDVMNSLLNNYIKMISVIEQHPDAVITESFKDDLNEPVTGNKNESIIKRILMSIPRLIHKIIETVHRLFLKAKIKMVGGTLDEIMAVDPKIRAQVQEAYQQAWDSINDIMQYDRDGEIDQSTWDDIKNTIRDGAPDGIQEAAKVSYVRDINKSAGYYRGLTKDQKQQCQIDISAGEITSSFRFDWFVKYINKISATLAQADSNTWDISNINSVNTLKRSLESSNRKAAEHLHGKDQTKKRSWIAGQTVYQCSELNQYLQTINQAQSSIRIHGNSLCTRISATHDAISNQSSINNYATALKALLYEIQNWQKIYVNLCSEFMTSINLLRIELNRAVAILSTYGVTITKQNW